MSSISKSETGFRELDLKIALCLGLGLSGDETARVAGCHRSTIYERKASNKSFIEEWSSFISAAAAASLAEKTNEMKAKLTRMYEKAYGVVDRSMDADDPRLAFQAAKEVIDRVDGKATQKIEQKTEVTETRKVEIEVLPTEEFKWILQTIKGSRALLTGDIPEEEVVEAELVSHDEPAAGS
jgi:hypothetical protein